jgi:enamine deaminase RidA (YjgF/YER057c/UK114 family)
MFRKYWFIIVIWMVLISNGYAEDPNKRVFHINPDFEADLGYSHAVRVGDVLYISGTVGWGDMPEAIDIAYTRIAGTLKENNLDFRHVVKETIFTTQLDALKAAKGTRKKYYGDSFPAATWVQVERLFNPDLILEVEVIAHFSAKAH